MRTVFFAILLSPSIALASTVLAVPEATLTHLADTIVLGTVVNVTPYVAADGHTRTRAQLAVYQGVRGAREGDTITIDVPGGRSGNGLVSSNLGAPDLYAGQMIFGFFETHGDVKRPLGLSYGVFNVRTDTHGKLIVERNLAGLHLLTQAADEPIRLAIEPLEHLIQRIVATVRAEGGAR